MRDEATSADAAATADTAADQTATDATDTTGAADTGEQTGGDNTTEAGTTALTGGDTTNDNATDDKTGDDDKGGDDDKTAIEYTDFTVPEGISIDEALLGEATPLFQELGLDQAAAQKVIDFYSGLQAKGEQAAADAFVAKSEGWVTAAKSDKEYGGDKFDENVGQAVAAIKEFGTPELRELLDDTGIGNHPEVIRFMYRVGATIKEDQPDKGGASSAPKTRVETLYS